MATPIAPPRAVTAAFLAFLAYTATTLASGVVVLATRPEFEDAVRASTLGSTPRLTDDQIRRTTSVGQGLLLVLTTLVALLYLWLSFKFRAGRGWARAVLTVGTLLQIAALVADGEKHRVELVGCAVAVVGTALGHLPSANAYVAAVKASGGSPA